MSAYTVTAHINKNQKQNKQVITPLKCYFRPPIIPLLFLLSSTISLLFGCVLIIFILFYFTIRCTIHSIQYFPFGGVVSLPPCWE